MEIAVSHAISNLPIEIWFMIFELCDIKMRAILMSVCKSFYSIIITRIPPGNLLETYGPQLKLNQINFCISVQELFAKTWVSDFGGQFITRSNNPHVINIFLSPNLKCQCHDNYLYRKCSDAPDLETCVSILYGLVSRITITKLSHNKCCKEGRTYIQSFLLQDKSSSCFVICKVQCCLRLHQCCWAENESIHIWFRNGKCFHFGTYLTWQDICYERPCSEFYL